MEAMAMVTAKRTADVFPADKNESLVSDGEIVRA
jgi:hypothetical protein